jgi:hypothetical protein
LVLPADLESKLSIMVGEERLGKTWLYLGV